MISRKELEVVMKLPRKAGLINKYKEIYKLATGVAWNSCLCGEGYNRLYNTCLNFSKDTNKLEKIYGMENN